MGTLPARRACPAEALLPAIERRGMLATAEYRQHVLGFCFPGFEFPNLTLPPFVLFLLMLHCFLTGLQSICHPIVSSLQQPEGSDKYPPPAWPMASV